MLITLEDNKGETYDLYMPPHSAVQAVKNELAEILKVDPVGIIIIFNGKFLINEMTLEAQGVTDQSKLVFVNKNVPIVKKNESKKPKHYSPPPNFMEKIANSPMGQQFMKFMEENPEATSEMFKNAPFLQGALENDPSISHMLNDTEFLTDTMKFATTPGNRTMAAMTTDRMFDNIEQNPIGLHLVNRTLRSIGDPMDVLQDEMNKGRFTTVIPNQDLEAPSAVPLPNGSVDFFQASIISEEDKKQVQNLKDAQAMIKEAEMKLAAIGIKMTNTDKIIKELNNEKARIAEGKQLIALKNMYGEQLEILKGMGFLDDRIDLLALGHANGNVEGAVALILKQRRRNKI